MDATRDITDYFSRHGITVKLKIVKPQDKKMIGLIHNLIFNGDFKVDVSDDSIISSYYGLYFRTKKDYDQMKKYLSIAVEKGSDNAAFWLAEYYYEQKDYENMIKYYLMAIE